MATPQSSGRRIVSGYAWGVLAFNVAVILWGALVRATGSGAGCGDHWPLCNGNAVPFSPSVATLIEFSHRVSSGVALIFVVFLAAAAFWVYPKRHLVRRAALIAVFFEFTEAAFGAALVLLGQTARNTSAGRAFTLSFHLINTLLLLTCLVLAAWASRRDSLRWRAGLSGWKLAYFACALSIVILSVTGVVAALGDTLFRASSLHAGFQQDFAPGASPLVRLRVWHPAIAFLCGAALLALGGWTIQRNFNPRSRSAALWLMILVVTQWAVGIVNVALLAPVPVQIAHLLVADLIWISFVIMGAEMFASTNDAASETTTGFPTATVEFPGEVRLATLKWRSKTED